MYMKKIWDEKKKKWKKGRKKGKNKKEESKLIIRKGRLGFNGGYPNQTPIKGGSGKGKKSQKAIQSMKSLHQRVKSGVRNITQKNDNC